MRFVDVSADGDLNFPCVEKCKGCKSSWIHLGSRRAATQEHFILTTGWVSHVRIPPYMLS